MSETGMRTSPVAGRSERRSSQIRKSDLVGREVERGVHILQESVGMSPYELRVSFLIGDAPGLPAKLPAAQLTSHPRSSR